MRFVFVSFLLKRHSLGPLRKFFSVNNGYVSVFAILEMRLGLLVLEGVRGFFYEIEYSCISCKLLVEFDPNDIFHLSDIKHFIDMQCKVDSFFVRE